jgi:hypothetical protein
MGACFRLTTVPLVRCSGCSLSACWVLEGARVNVSNTSVHVDLFPQADHLPLPVRFDVDQPEGVLRVSGEGFAVQEFYVVGDCLIFPVESDPRRWVNVDANGVLPAGLDLSPRSVAESVDRAARECVVPRNSERLWVATFMSAQFANLPRAYCGYGRIWCFTWSTHGFSCCPVRPISRDFSELWHGYGTKRNGRRIVQQLVGQSRGRGLHSSCSPVVLVRLKAEPCEHPQPYLRTSVV